MLDGSLSPSRTDSKLIDRAKLDLSDNVRVRGDAGYVGPEILALLDKK